MEVRDNRIVIISDLTIRGEDLDPVEIKSALEEIRKKIKSASEGEITVTELEDAIIEQKKLKAKSEITKKVNIN